MQARTLLYDAAGHPVMALVSVDDYQRLELLDARAEEARTAADHRKLELFARGEAPDGWTFWGNECEE